MAYIYLLVAMVEGVGWLYRLFEEMVIYLTGVGILDKLLENACLLWISVSNPPLWPLWVIL